MRGLRRRLASAVALLLLPASAAAYIQLVTLPDRDSVQLTIYNSADITMVRETRVLTLQEGRNTLDFSWSGTLIDPTSVKLRPLGEADSVEVRDVSYPPDAPESLVWHLHSQVDGRQEVEITYFTSGITWAADYLLEARPDRSRAELSGYVRITNRSGEDYENARVRLVVGVIHMVESVAELARRGRERPRALKDRFRKAVAQAEEAREAGRAAPSRPSRPKEIEKQGISEYYLYTIEGKETIPDTWSKRLRSFEADGVPVQFFHRYEEEAYGSLARRFYRIENEESSKLGSEPLPAGLVQVFRLLGSERERTAYVGRDRTKYVPVGETAELDLGPDPRLPVEAVLKRFQRDAFEFDEDGDVKGWNELRDYAIRVQNTHDRPVTLEIRRNLSGDWELEPRGPHRFEPYSEDKVRLRLRLEPYAEETVRYRVVTHHGSRAGR